MSKLFLANMNRLFKSKSFIITASAMLVLTIFSILIDCNSNSKLELGKTFDDLYFRMLPNFSLYIAFFASMFIGTEYSDLTIRNKIVVGHSRPEVFTANLMTCTAASVIFFIIWAVSGCVGIPYFGIENIDLNICLPKLLVSFFTVIAVTAVFGTIAQLITSKATGAVAAIFAALALLLAGSFFYNALTEPETTASYVMISEEGGVEFGDEVPNPAYVGGKMRDVYEVMLRLLPTGQQILIADEPLEKPAFMIVCSVVVAIIATSVGYLGFRRKDLR